MEGKNELRLNAATLNKAVEFYLNSEVFQGDHAVKVVSIVQSSDYSQVSTVAIEPKGDTE